MTDHPTDCICKEVCAPISLPTRSPIVDSTLAAGPDSDLAQALGLFRLLDARHKKLFLAMLGAAVKVQGPGKC